MLYPYLVLETTKPDVYNPSIIEFNAEQNLPNQIIRHSSIIKNALKTTGKDLEINPSEGELIEILANLECHLCFPLLRTHANERKVQIGWRNYDETVFLRWTNLIDKSLDKGYLNLVLLHESCEKNLHLSCHEFKNNDWCNILNWLKGWKGILALAA
jgi:hypothetical protein